MHTHGGFVAILDLNVEVGNQTVTSLGDRVKFFETDITETESIQKAVSGIVEWTKQTGAAIGGVIPSAGVGNPAKLLDRHNGKFIAGQNAHITASNTSDTPCECHVKTIREIC